MLAPYMSPRKPGGMTDPWLTLGNVAQGRFVTSEIDDFVVYTWVMGHALLACQDGSAQVARLITCTGSIVGVLSCGRVVD